MKLEVGMYVRDIKGRIDKIIGFKGALIEFEKDLMGGYIDCNDFTKASFNIIDLIEVGNYVNGSKVIKIENVENYPDLLNVKIEKSDFRYGVYETIFEKDIKSVITKEQFEQMAYKVGE